MPPWLDAGRLRSAELDLMGLSHVVLGLPIPSDLLFGTATASLVLVLA